MTTVVDEAARDALLREEAKAAKLTDSDLLKIAKRGLSPADAVADLRTRYPKAFAAEPAKRYADMTTAEREAFARQHRVIGVSSR